MSFMGETSAVPGTNRPRLLQAMVDAFRQEDVRRKLLFTLAMLVIFRFVAHVPVPNVDRDALEAAFDGNAVLDFLSIFSGGALQNLSVAALGVYPYITSSIIMQIVTPLSPRLKALQEEGEQGRRRIQVYTHWLAVPMAFVQGYGQILFINNQSGEVVRDFGFQNDFVATIATLFTLAAGTMFLVWLGELITEHGIGNGISLIIFGGIVAVLPGLIPEHLDKFDRGDRRHRHVRHRPDLLHRLLPGGATESAGAVRPLLVQRGADVPATGAELHPAAGEHGRNDPADLRFLSIVIMPAVVAGYFSNAGGWLEATSNFLVDNFQGGRGGGGSGVYWLVLFVLVVAFAFFYSLIQYNQQNIAKNLQQQGAFIPGIRPGPPTEAYLLRVVTRITWGGALFLGMVAIAPFFIGLLTDVQALTISSTGFLIVVAVVLDTMKQLEAQLLMRNYEGFIR